jgi:hypothetical protein
VACPCRTLKDSVKRSSAEPLSSATPDRLSSSGPLKVIVACHAVHHISAMHERPHVWTVCMKHPLRCVHVNIKA